MGFLGGGRITGRFGGKIEISKFVTYSDWKSVFFETGFWFKFQTAGLSTKSY